MSRRRRQSKRRVKSLLSIMLLTAMLLVFSTYAWFSANRAVSLTGINSKVSAAEGLQISLDGLEWKSSFAISKATLDAATGNVHRWPDELTPVSTVGGVTTGALDMFYGTTEDGQTLTGVAKEADATQTKYISFDLYFKNSSSQTGGDNLQWNLDTKVAIASDGVEGTGLENCARAAIVLYSGSQILSADPTDIRAIASGTPQVSIWEPNYKQHTSEIVKNDSRIDATTTEWQTLGVKSAGSGTITGIDGSAEGTTLGLQNTVTTDGGGFTAATNAMDIASTQIKLQANKIMKARIYIWIEGQDPDCIDTASTGKSIDFVIGFTKPAPSGSSGGSGG